MSDEEYEPYQWQIGDPSDWGDSVGVPDIPYMGYINNGDGDDERPPEESFHSRDEGLSRRALDLEEQGRYEEALEVIDRALRINSFRPNNWNVKAIILDNWGRNEEALKYYDKSLEMRDSDVVRGNKAQCLYRIVKNHVNFSSVTREDLHTINEALKILPDDDGRNDYIHIKGSVLEALGNQLQAKKCFLLAAGMFDEIKELENQTDTIRKSTHTLINISGTKHYSASRKLKKGSVVDLIREYENRHDPDAIRVDFNGETVGYVGNSKQTVPDGVSSATDIKYRLVNDPKAEVMFWYMDHYLIARVI